MAIYPGALNKPITAAKGRKALTIVNRVNLHVAVSEASSLHGAFNRTGVPDSHFYVRRDGTLEQYVDTSMRAFADLEGNDATISIETQGGVINADSEPWTPQQLETLARLYAWVVRTHGVARKLATSSQIGDASKGLSWHRLGIDGNFPALPDIAAGRKQRGGGMHYSKAAGKLCPGAGKIRQIPSIFDRAMVLLDGGAGGGAVTPPASTPQAPAPTPPPKAPAPVPGFSQAIADVQARLNRDYPAYSKLAVDGLNGPKTKAVVREFQRRAGLVVDGIAGPKTRAKLGL